MMCTELQVLQKTVAVRNVLYECIRTNTLVNIFVNCYHNRSTRIKKCNTEQKHRGAKTDLLTFFARFTDFFDFDDDAARHAPAGVASGQAAIVATKAQIVLTGVHNNSLAYLKSRKGEYN